MGELSDRTVVVIGASGRIGAAVVRDLLDRGATVVGVGRDQGRLDELRATTGDRVHVRSADLAVEGGPAALAAALAADGLRPHGVVLAARDLGRLGDDGRQAWLDELLLAVVAPDELVEALASDPASVLDAVVHVSSMYGLVAPPRSLYDSPDQRPPARYGVAKAAVLHLAREQAVRYGERGIRVNAIAYGGVRGRADAAFEARYGALAPSGRMLDDADLPGAVAFLLGSGASGVTGHTVVVDGGWTAW